MSARMTASVFTFSCAPVTREHYEAAIYPNASISEAPFFHRDPGALTTVPRKCAPTPDRRPKALSILPFLPVGP